MPKLNWVESCPFMHDSYSKGLKELSDLIMIQLKNKIDGNNQCQGTFNSIIQNLNTINVIFGLADNNPALFEEIKEKLYSNQITKLRLELLTEGVN